ncbi:MAG: hypothetical protein JST81_12325 [Bacteroidetes bacterium]|nr:hypothetical protein [Bacteroidota bacterium]
MINNSPFDEHFKKQFGNYKPEVPPQVWENIMAEKEKRKPVGFFFNTRNGKLLIAALLLLLAGGGYLFLQNNTPGNTEQHTGSVNNVNSTEKTNGLSQRNTNAINEPTSGSVSTGTNATAQTPAEGTTHNNNNNIIEENTVATGTGNTVKNASTSRQHDEAVNENGKLTVTTNRNTEKEIRTASNNSHHPNPEHARNAVANAGNEDTDANDGNESMSTKRNTKAKSAAKHRLKTDSPDAEGLSQDATEEKNTSENDIAVSSLTKSWLDVNSNPFDKTFSLSIKELKMPAYTIPCPGVIRNEAANTSYFDVYGGPDYVFRTFNDTANSTYLKKRKESTRFTSAFSIGIRYTKVFGNGLSFRTGINYSQINEQFKYAQSHIVQNVYELGPVGDTIGSYATTGTRYKTTRNRYKTVDIPLTLGYEFGNKKLRTNINAGVIFNAYSWQKGDVLDSALQPVSITTGKTNSAYQFKTNVGIGFTAAASFYYHVTGKMYLLGEPYFRYNFSPANKSGITLKQKYTTVGLRLGVRIDF